MNALYDVLVALHVASALVGFGSLALSGIYGFGIGRPRREEALEEARRYFSSPGRLELLVLIVPFLGAAALVVEPHGRGLGQLWAGLATGVWAVAAGTLVWVVRPAERLVKGAIATGDLDVAAEAGGRLGWASLLTDLAFVGALGLMLFQPR